MNFGRKRLRNSSLWSRVFLYLQCFGIRFFFAAYVFWWKYLKNLSHVFPPSKSPIFPWYSCAWIWDINCNLLKSRSLRNRWNTWVFLDFGNHLSVNATDGVLKWAKIKNTLCRPTLWSMKENNSINEIIF